ncbi:MAG: hypothetical protein H7Z37_15220 [Pyrinomonadaceae bacterium]|nr:hypothetical protein [Pyrinomonadaceae bacterium]
MSENFNFVSSVADDVWHNRTEKSAYEWWYFDAISDDGRDAIVVIFLDNFVFSPRYNKAQSPKSEVQSLESTVKPDFLDSEIQSQKSEIRNPKRVPAVTFFYYRDGKPIYRGINEFDETAFSANKNFPHCKIGGSDFTFEATPYGTRYILNVETILRGGKTLKASLEWLIIESDFLPAAIKDDDADSSSDSHYWNLASPRSDVSGKVEIFDRNNNLFKLNQFRGSGYHDHNFDSRWMPQTVKNWQWGRAHFADATAVFYRYQEFGKAAPTTKLFLIKDNELSILDVNCRFERKRRDRFGLKFPRKLCFTGENGISLTVKQNRLIDGSFFYLRFFSDMILDLNDGKKREVVGISEHLAPRPLGWRWLDWLVNMRISRNGKGAFLP